MIIILFPLYEGCHNLHSNKTSLLSGLFASDWQTTDHQESFNNKEKESQWIHYSVIQHYLATNV